MYLIPRAILPDRRANLPNTNMLALNKDMAPEQLHIYTEETYIHAQLALSNYQTLLNIVNDPNSRQSREAWMFLQSFLSHFGMVLKLLYAPSSRQKISKDRAR